MTSSNVIQQKAELRREGYDARRDQPEPEAASHAAIQALLRLPQYTSAATVLWYVNCRTELQTQRCLPGELRSDKTIVVPYCTEQDGEPRLGLWRLENLDELAVGKWKILEPPSDRWSDDDRVIVATQLDTVIVPGVAFTKDGKRLGNGQGYYDRLLRDVRPTCQLIGLCYESQILPKLPAEEHDVRMNFVITEKHVYQS